jgi:D-mannonate dehydratase
MKSHDVRQMHECIVCGGIGFYKLPDCAENFLVVVIKPQADGWRVYAHPRCFVTRHGIEKLLALPDEELNSIRLCDVSLRTMRSIMNRKKV